MHHDQKAVERCGATPCLLHDAGSQGLAERAGFQIGFGEDDRRRHDAGDHFGEKFFLGAKVAIDHHRCPAGAGTDFPEARSVVAAAGEGLAGGGEDGKAGCVGIPRPADRAFRHP